MLEISWHNRDARGWRDFLSFSEFESVGERANLAHSSIYKNRRYQPVFSINVEPEKATLFYEKQEAAYEGEMELSFADSSRMSVTDVRWRSPHGGWKNNLASWNDTTDFEVAEGSVNLIQHVKRERDSRLRSRKLAETPNDHRCRACGDDFTRFFDIPTIVEVHHNIPISRGERISNLSQLELLCPTCHRAIHQTGSEMMTVNEFQAKYFKI